MYAAGALRVLLTFLGFLLPVLVLFFVVTLIARMLRGRERKEAGKTQRRVQELEDEVRRLRLRIDARSARDAEPAAPPALTVDSTAAGDIERSGHD